MKQEKGVYMGEGDGTVSLLYLSLAPEYTDMEIIGIHVCKRLENREIQSCPNSSHHS